MTLTQDLRRLGVELGDLLFIHSSFKSLGPVKDGVETVIRALEDAVGPDGLILMPSFNLVDRRAETWNIDTTPSTVGWITEFFRQIPGTYRSDHYSHAVAARGKGAEAFVDDHLRLQGYQSPWDRQPWGKTYGTYSPMYKAYEADGKLLMLGVDYNSSTYIHFVEVIRWNMALESDPSAKYPGLDRLKLGAFWDGINHLQRGSVGHADCRLFRIREYVDTLLGEVARDPNRYLR